MKAAEVGRSRWGGPSWPGTVVLVQDRAATVRVLTAVSHRGPGAAWALRSLDAVGGLEALESVLAAVPAPDLVVVDGATCGELSADILFALECGRDRTTTRVMLLTETAVSPQPELLAMADLWAVKGGEIEGAPDIIRLLPAALASDVSAA